MSGGRPLDAYVRVSQVRGREGERFISPAVQADRIAAWAQHTGVQVGEVLEELDVSGGKIERPLLDQALARIEAGVSGGLVVAYMDRFSRSLVDGVLVMDRVRKAGGRFVAIDIGFDTAATDGELNAQIMLAVAQDHLRRIRGNWDEARRRAVERGIHPCAVPPFGYQHGEDGRLVVDEAERPWVERIYTGRAGGARWAELRAALADAGVTTRRGNSFSLRALRDIIRSDVYLGVARHGEFENRTAHEAIVDRGLWMRAQKRGHAPKPSPHAASGVVAVVRCAGCRYLMRSQRRELADGTLRIDLRCRASSEQMTSRCSAPAGTARGVELEEYLVAAFLDRMDEVRATVTEHAGRGPELERELQQAQSVLDALATDARAQEAMGMTSYLRALEVRRREVDRLAGELDAELRASGAGQLLDADLRGIWQTLTVTERRRLLSSATDAVFVHRGGPDIPIDELVTILWAGEAPDLDLPRGGRKDYVARPYDLD